MRKLAAVLMLMIVAIIGLPHPNQQRTQLTESQTTTIARRIEKGTGTIAKWILII